MAGLQISSASVGTERGRSVYELDGTVAGRAYEIEVTAEGQVLAIESDD